ncbi:hypothetical protein O6H91_05G025200 [Diphasiastrum complanatum]|uniref:Uncharacterized protein n=4 Tax=Diphasiastrum complanatum TaxID=34168 RepID=A0ACC2DLK1_DIPCM|nr:hypothetical protein O6H91_05G025200 [Diphasiastrum complanatum]KAJ7555177.1 hypothetical protein O6H91_05G025200 [Diphasiastrum complanatum]KAJ7555178.1 hypothetical protein O6H91_05G025200 [Diphasiastrum complanatum]KAJ7555179.1 hypothetical protein O6H91_05G025200 [Diphasiastrum complanatum]
MACVPMLSVNWKDNHKRKRAPLGFKNLGNTCYLNSVLQCLTYTPPLANFCLQGLHSSECNLCGSDQQCPFCLLETRIAYHLSTEVTVDVPVKIYRRIQTFAKSLRPGRQEDAHELLRCAIDACNNVCLQLQKRSLVKKLENTGQMEEPHTVVKEIFGGSLQSQVRCLSCNYESNKLDDIMDLSLEVLQAKTLKEALCNFFQSELLDGSNKYNCENCKRLSTARKQMSLHQAPNVLVIQFKRFENIFGGKIDRHIGFEEQLQLSPYMSKSSKDLWPDYTLYGVLVHVGGSQFSGHYYAYVKDASGEWYCCDDAHVVMEPVKSVLNEKAYMLFYVRNNLRPKAVPCSEMTPSPPTTPDADMSEPSRVKFPSNKLANMQTAIATKGDASSRILNKAPVKFEIKIGNMKNAVVQCKKPEVGFDVSAQNHKSSVTSCTTKEKVAEVQASLKRDISLQSNGQMFAAVSQPESPILTAKLSGDSMGMFRSSCLSDTKNNEKASNCFQNNHDAVTASSQDRRLDDLDTGNIATVMSKTSGGMQNHDPSQILNEIIINGQNQPQSNGFSKKIQDTVGSGFLRIKDNSGAMEVSTANQLLQLSELDRLKLLLEKEGREELQRCGWCNTLRHSLRAAKRQRLTLTKDGTNATFGDLRKELIEDVKPALIRQVPQALKEQLVEQLHTYFICKNP